MKVKKLTTYKILAPFTLIALLVLLSTQLIWLFQTAKVEQKFFKKRVYQALNEAGDEIASRAPACNSMMNYLCGKHCMEYEKIATVAEIDSIVYAKLVKHKIEIEYNFEIIGDNLNGVDKSKCNTCFLQKLNGTLEEEGIELQVVFPNKTEFVLAQLKGIFLIAFFALFFVAISFYITFKLFNRQRRMLQTTSDFINNMVHEFQTPISNIKLATNLIRKQGDDKNLKLNEYTGIILKENKKLLSHVNDILNIAENGRNAIEFQTIDMHELIEYIIADFECRIDAVNGKIETNLGATKYLLQGSRNHFNHMLSNLIDNAIKYSKEAPEITINTYNKDSKLFIEVIDNGIGISKQDISLIFDRYYRVSTGNVHNVKGFGLGLTYIQKIVDYYNGKIKVSSQLGKGSKFCVIFMVCEK